MGPREGCGQALAGSLHPEHHRCTAGTRPPARYCFVNGGGGLRGLHCRLVSCSTLMVPRGGSGGAGGPRSASPSSNSVGRQGRCRQGTTSVGRRQQCHLDTPAHGNPSAPRGLTWSRGLPRQAGAEPPHALMRDQPGQAQPFVHQRLLEDVATPEPVGGEAKGHIRGRTRRWSQPGTGPHRCGEKGKSQC